METSDLTKQIGKSAKRDWENKFLEELSAKGEKARWAQVKQLKTGYKPRVHEKHDAYGRPITLRRRRPPQTT